MSWAEFWNIVFQLLPYIMTACVSVYAIWHTGKIKRLELKDSEKGRVFQIQKKITDKSIDSLWKAHYILAQQIPAVITIIQGTDHIDEKTMEGIQKAHEFIKSHAIYFPLDIREDLISASYHLNNIIEYKDSFEQKIKLEMFTASVTIMQKAKKALEDFIDKFNLLNQKL